MARFARPCGGVTYYILKQAAVLSQTDCVGQHTSDPFLPGCPNSADAPVGGGGEAGGGRLQRDLPRE
eukprot:974133-Pyramimonas_sp.AAC.1